MFANRSRSRKLHHRRRLRLFEFLEDRRMLAADFQNPRNRHDVNADQRVSPIDALLVINQLNATGSRSLVTDREGAGESAFTGFIDTNGDEALSPIDALLVINVLADFAVNTAQDESATPLAAT